MSERVILIQRGSGRVHRITRPFLAFTCALGLWLAVLGASVWLGALICAGAT